VDFILIVMRGILFLGLFLLYVTVHSQTQPADSLVSLLENNKLSNTERLQLYKNITEYYRYSDPEKSIIYGERGLRLAEKEKDKRMMAFLSMDIGNTLFDISTSDSILIFYNKAIDLSREIGDESIEAMANGMIGDYYFKINKKGDVLEYYLKSLTSFESLGDMYNSTRLLLSISDFYSDLYQTEYALHYTRRAQVYAESLDHPVLKTGIFTSLGSHYLTVRDYDKALENALIALDMSREHNLVKYEVINTRNLAEIYADGFKDYKTAEKYSLECEKVALESNNQNYIMTAWNTLTKVYINANKYNEGKEIALKVWNMDSTNFAHSINTAYFLAVSYLYTGNPTESLYYFNKRDNLRWKESENQFFESLSNMEVKYETNKKEIRIDLLEKEKKLYVWLVIAGALLAISLGIVLRQKIKSSRKENQLIAARAVQDGEMGERARIAEDLHDRLGGSLSAVKIELNSTDNLQSVSDKLDECIKEVREITHNLMPRSLRMSGLKTALEDFSAQFSNVHFHFYGKEGRIKERLEFIIYCCANELITNSLRYSGAENINVQLIQEVKHVSLVVDDDGCGFDENTVTKGIGLKNIRDRVASCNGKLDIATSPGKGTETIIELMINV